MRPKSRTTAALRAQRGVGLIEVLVAVLVLAIGLLAVAGLQLRSLRDNESSSERGVAVMMTHSIFDAMRADRTNAINNQYNIDFDDATPTGTSFRDVAIAGWRASLTTAIGAGAKGRINCDGPECTVQIRWDDSRGTRGADDFTVTTVAQL